MQNVTFDVNPGEIVALVGVEILAWTAVDFARSDNDRHTLVKASGAGKSSILRLCARLADPQEQFHFLPEPLEHVAFL